MVRAGVLLLALGMTIATGAEAAGRRARPQPAAVSKPCTETPPQTFVLGPPPPPPAQATSRFGVVGQKYAAPQTRMSQAGVLYSVSKHLSLQLSYERTAYAPLMPQDHDNGILTGLRVGF